MRQYTSASMVPVIEPYTKERGSIVIVDSASLLLPDEAVSAFDGSRVCVSVTDDAPHDKEALLSLRGICYRSDKADPRSTISCDGIIVCVPAALTVGQCYRVVCEAT